MAVPAWEHSGVLAVPLSCVCARLRASPLTCLHTSTCLATSSLATVDHTQPEFVARLIDDCKNCGLIAQYAVLREPVVVPGHSAPR